MHPILRSKTLDIWEFDPSQLLFLRGGDSLGRRESPRNSRPGDSYCANQAQCRADATQKKSPSMISSRRFVLLACKQNANRAYVGRAGETGGGRTSARVAPRLPPNDERCSSGFGVHGLSVFIVSIHKNKLRVSNPISRYIQ